MSTYYALACDTCLQYTNFIVRSFPSRVGWMVHATDAIPSFVETHLSHVDTVRVIDEHDPRWETYADMSPPDEEE